MEVAYILLAIFSLILSIFLIVKFCGIASDLRVMKNMALEDFQLARLNLVEVKELQKILQNTEPPQISSKYIFEFDNAVRIEFDTDLFRYAYHEFGLWRHTEGGNIFYFRTKDEAIKAMCYFSTQN